MHSLFGSLTVWFPAAPSAEPGDEGGGEGSGGGGRGCGGGGGEEGAVVTEPDGGGGSDLEEGGGGPSEEGPPPACSVPDPHSELAHEASTCLPWEIEAHGWRRVVGV